jgi:RHS repeat-associated protein
VHPRVGIGDAHTQNNITHAYTYDTLDRLLSATGTGTNPYNQSYTYDLIGNITYKSDVGNYSYTYGNQPHAVTSAGNIALQYDNNGNMTQRAVSGGDTLAITYSQDNMPTGIAKNGSSYIAYTYDGNGQRIRKQNLFTGNTVLYFGEVYEVRNNVGVIHLFAGSTRVASIRSDGYEQYYHSDHLGSASVITDASGNQQQTIQYFPYGAYRQNTTNPNFPSVNYTFTDQENDDDTGLYNYKARLYDPVLGRFLSADSIIPDPGNLQSYNRYSYCLNNPLIYTDPSGHSWLSSALRSVGSFFSDVGKALSNPTTLAVLAIGVACFIGAGMVIAAME